MDRQTAENTITEYLKPVLYCEIPQAFHEVDEDQAFRDFLNTYIQEMEKDLITRNVPMALPPMIC